MTSLALPDTQAIDLARESLYRFLAAAVADPWAAAWPLLFDPANRAAACAAADLLRQDAAEMPVGFGELPPSRLDLRPAVAALPSTPEALRDEYHRVFGLIFARECPPYETEYHGAGEAFFRAQQMADVAGFYRAFGVAPSSRRPERPDHIALELEFMALLLMKKRLAAERRPDAEQVRVCADAEAAFFRDHLAWWVPLFAAGLRRKAGGGFYAAVAEALAALMPLERARFRVPAPRMPLRSSDEQTDAEAECAGCSA